MMYGFAGFRLLEGDGWWTSCEQIRRKQVKALVNEVTFQCGYGEVSFRLPTSDGTRVS